MKMETAGAVSKTHNEMSSDTTTILDNSNSSELDPILGQEVAIGSIDAELRKLWAVDKARTNACLINFAFYSEQKGSLTLNSRIVSELTRDHASRALLIEMDRSASQPSLRAWVTAHCHLSQGKKSVCCEQIAFALTGVSRGRLRNTVFAHLSSDLPLILWWQGELSPIFEERLYSVIDRFVFDSSSWSNPQASFTIIDQAVHGSRPRSLVVNREPSSAHIHMRLIVGDHITETLAPAGCDDCAMLIGDQLARGGKNSLFLKILPLFQNLLESQLR